jgi:phospholipid N-methyltransferase
MPNLTTTLHTDMLRGAKRAGQIDRDGLYGMQWGDPQKVQFLKYVRDNYLMPFVNPDHSAVEIGPGGGRWTKYMLAFERLYAVDFYQDLLDELQKNFRSPALVFLKNNGTDFPGVLPRSIDFVFSFGCFVHLDVPVISKYLESIAKICKASANIVIHYSDKEKDLAKRTQTFSENTPTIMRNLVIDKGYRILKEDSDIFPHSAIMLIAPR